MPENSKKRVLARRPARLPANYLKLQGVTLSSVLTFISHAQILSLRAIKIALLARRDRLEYSVFFKSGRREDWQVDSTDQMIDILVKERREIIHVSRGKEFMNE